MKTNILLLTIILFGAVAWGQEEEDCSTIKDDTKRISCLEEKLKAEKEKKESLKILLDETQKNHEDEKAKNEFFKIGDSNYYIGKYSEVLVDFSKASPIISVPNKIRKGDFYQVKVKNFNPNRYSVEIKSNDSLVTKALKLPTYDDFSLDNLSVLTSGLNSNFVQTNAGFPEPTSLDSLAPNQGAEIKKRIEEAYGAATSGITSKEVDLTALKETWDSFKFNIYKRRLYLLKEIPIPSNNDFNFDNALNESENLRKQSDSVKTLLLVDQKKYLDVVDHKRAKDFLELAVNKELKAKVEALKKVYASFFNKIGEFKGLISADNLEKLLKTILFQTDSDEYISLPIQFKGDIEELSISFVPKDSTSGLQKEALPTLIFPVQNSWYWSVATSFYYSNLGNDRIISSTSRDSEENAEYLIESLARTPREAGFSTMLRVGKKFKPYDGLIGAHVGFGPGVSFEKNVRPRLLFGGGISIGRKHNLTIDYGGILGYVDRISDKVPKTGSGEAPNPLITEIMIGNYFSIGYMFKL